jgi:branched-chain amino acid transport system substrate-binding protein
MQNLNKRFSAFSIALITASLASAHASNLAPIEIAAILSLSGPYSDVGFMEARALATEVSLANEHDGINGHPIDLHLFDDESRTGVAYLIADRVVKAGHAQAIIGGSTTPTCQAMHLSTSQHQVVQYCLSNDQTHSPAYFSSFAAPQRIFGDIPAAFMSEHRLQRVAIIVRNNHSGKVYDQALETAMGRTSLELIQTTSVANTDEARDATNAALNNCADVVYVGGDRALEMDVLQQVRKRHKKTTVWLVDAAAGSPDAITLSTVLPRGPVYSTANPVYVADQLPDTDPQRAKLVNYVRTFTKYNSGLQPNTYAVITSDATRFIIAGLRTVSGVGGFPLAQTIEARTNVHGLYSDYHFSAQNHNGAVGPNTVMRMQPDGSLQFVERLSQFADETVIETPPAAPASLVAPVTPVETAAPVRHVIELPPIVPSPKPLVEQTPAAIQTDPPAGTVNSAPVEIPVSSAPPAAQAPAAQTPETDQNADADATPAPSISKPVAPESTQPPTMMNQPPAASTDSENPTPSGTSAPALPPGTATPVPIDTD